MLRAAHLPQRGVRVIDPRRPAGTAALTIGALLSAGLGFAAVVLLGASPITREELPLDDAWIHLAYGRGLLRDGLPSYNPGRPEAGFSSPLWVLCAAVVLLVARASGLAAALLLKGASAAFGGLAAGALARLAADQGASPRVALVVALVAPLGPWWCTSAASGMEITLTTLLLALALSALQHGRRGRAGAFVAMATLARPECAACVPALLLARAALPQRVALALPTALAVGAWVAYDLAVTGHPWPNTFYAKALRVDGASSLRFAAATLAEDGAVVALVLVALAAAGLARARRTAPGAGWSWFALSVVPIVGVLASRSLNPAVLLYLRRYLYPFLLLLWGPAALGIQVLVDAVAALPLARPRLVAALGAAFAALAVAPSVLAARSLHAGWCLDVAALHTAPALAIARGTPLGAVVAVEGAGASRYFADREIVDLVGLNEHELVHHPRGGTAHLCHLLRVRRPTWFVLPSSWVPRFAPAWRFVLQASFRRDHYTQVDPPARREVLILRAEARPEALARCGPLSASGGAAPAPPSAP